MNNVSKTKASLRFKKKKRKNIDNFPGYIEKFSLFFELKWTIKHNSDIGSINYGGGGEFYLIPGGVLA